MLCLPWTVLASCRPQFPSQIPWLQAQLSSLGCKTLAPPLPPHVQWTSCYCCKSPGTSMSHWDPDTSQLRLKFSSFCCCRVRSPPLWGHLEPSGHQSHRAPSTALHPFGISAPQSSVSSLIPSFTDSNLPRQPGEDSHHPSCCLSCLSPALQPKLFHSIQSFQADYCPSVPHTLESRIPFV